MLGGGGNEPLLGGGGGNEPLLGGGGGNEPLLGGGGGNEPLLGGGGREPLLGGGGANEPWLPTADGGGRTTAEWLQSPSKVQTSLTLGGSTHLGHDEEALLHLVTFTLTSNTEQRT